MIKQKAKRSQLMESETLKQRITEAHNHVSLSLFVNITQHSKHHLENFLNEVSI